MSMEKQMEMAQLMARFKLQVKRTLSETVDLDRLNRDLDYARQRLSEIEEAALDEELLIMVLRLRDHLLPVTPAAAVQAEISSPATSAPAHKETRNYLMGARSW